MTEKPETNEETRIAEAIEYATSLFENGNLEEALTAFQTTYIPEQFPRRSAQKYHNIGVISFELNNRKKAFGALKKAIEFDPDDVQAYSLLAKLSYERGDYTQAKKYAESAIKIAPERKDLHDLLSIIKQRD